jgi:hypothetical protein
MQPYIQGLSSEVFDQVMLHMQYCASTYRAHAERDQRKTTLSQLFVSCDHSGVSTVIDTNLIKVTGKHNSPLQNIQILFEQLISVALFPLYILIQYSYVTLYMPCCNLSLYQVGVLDRHRVLDLFCMFFDKSVDQVKDVLRNPRRCMY